MSWSTESAASHRQALWRRLLQWGGYGLFASATLLLLLHYLLDESALLLRLVNYLFIPFVCAYLLLSLLLLLRTPRWIGAIGVLVSGFALAPYPHLWRLTPPPAEDDLTLLTYSVRGLNHDYAAVVRVLGQACPDVAVMQEVTRPDALRAELAKLHCHTTPYHYYTHAEEAALGVVSRYPVSVESSRQAGIFTVDTGARMGLLSLWNVHAPKSFTDPRPQREWAKKLIEVAQEKGQGKVLLVGDFNMTPDNLTYHLITEQFHDAFALCGGGPGFTFPSEGRRMTKLIGPVLRIDYLFLPDEVACSSARVLDESGHSDHRPVLFHIH